MVLKTHHIVARDLPDLWFQAVSGLFNKGRKFVVDQGSYDGDGNKKDAQERLQYDFFTGHILNPGYGSGTPEILPQIPAHYNIPNPVAFEYVYGGEGYTRSYLEYVMTAVKQPGESYTYGERLVKAELSDRILALMFQGNPKMINPRKVDGKIIFMDNDRLYLNQIEAIIDTYKKFGPGNNQMVLQVAQPEDLQLKDPPCLRSIGTQIIDNKLHFTPVEFRSWDLWGGLPANLAAIQGIKEYMAGEIGVEDGEMIVQSKKLHIYTYAEELAKIRCMKR